MSEYKKMNSNLDLLVPHYHFSEHHQLSMTGDLDDIFMAVEAADLSDSLVSRVLITLWRLIANVVLKKPPKKNTSVKDFALLCRSPPNFIARGLIGGKNAPEDKDYIDSDSFLAFKGPGSIKLVWAFWLESTGENIVCVHTETRVFCTDKKTKLKFTIYWYLIRPWSGLIRRRMLVAIKKGVQNKL
jgi:hypothetical protein